MKNTDSQTTDGAFQLKLSLFYVVLFLSVGCYLPYFSIWLKDQGLNGDQSALILAAPMIIRIIFTPIVSIWADYEGNYRKILIILALGSLISLCTMSQISGFWAIFIVASLNAIFGSSLIPLTETLAVIGVKANQLRYGRARSWGSAAFIAGSLLTGILVDFYGPEVVLPFLIFAAIAIVCAAVYLPPPQGKGRLRDAVSGGKISWAGIFGLLRHHVFWVFLIGAGLGQACHAFYYGFSSRLWQDFGYSGWLIGVLWTIGVVSEILLFLYFGDWLRRFNPVLLIVAGATASFIRWMMMGLEPDLWLVIGLQILHAFSFGLAHLGAMYFIGLAVPDRLSATAQGVYATMSMGVFMGIAVLISGPLYDEVGSSGYFVMAGIAAFSVLVSFYLLASWDKAHIVED
ncbi:major facilitator superfamily domain-containing protein 6 [Hyphomicrobiales bacterium 4NK60-0047b]|jgi:PPP family 3-phenylpropionic acid transporter